MWQQWSLESWLSWHSGRWQRQRSEQMPPLAFDKLIKLEGNELIRPVRFQILANGRPLPRDVEIASRIVSENQSISSDVNVKADGIVELSSGDFTLPDRPVTAVEFKMLGVGEGAVILETKLSPPWNLIKSGRLI
jgi:hypothetical protein